MRPPFRTWDVPTIACVPRLDWVEYSVAWRIASTTLRAIDRRIMHPHARHAHLSQLTASALVRPHALLRRVPLSLRVSVILLHGMIRRYGEQIDALYKKAHDLLIRVSEFRPSRLAGGRTEASEAQVTRSPMDLDANDLELKPMFLEECEIGSPGMSYWNGPGPPSSPGSGSPGVSRPIASEGDGDQSLSPLLATSDEFSGMLMGANRGQASSEAALADDALSTIAAANGLRTPSPHHGARAFDLGAQAPVCLPPPDAAAYPHAQSYPRHNLHVRRMLVDARVSPPRPVPSLRKSPRSLPRPYLVLRRDASSTCTRAVLVHAHADTQALMTEPCATR